MRQASLRSYSHSEQSKKICHVLEHSAACILLEEIVGQLMNRNLVTRYSVLVVCITCNVTCIHACHGISDPGSN